MAERFPTTERLEEPAALATARLGSEAATLPADERQAAARRIVLDRYRLERRLGAGGFGVVWRAFDEKLEREVAVKEISREGDEPLPARAVREARVAARLNHPGIVALYELAADDDAVYLVSELVPGRTLAELHAARALADADVAQIGVALCDALAHAHGRRVVHRDVKPGNVLVVADPAAGAGFAKLADFGVAHLASGDPLTRTGDVVGTLAYMAPEQAEGAHVTAAVDVYALALTLYECWAGANPVRAPGPVATARRLGTALPPLGSRRRDLPRALRHTIDEALDPDPARRPPLRVLRAALEAAVPVLSDRGGLEEPATLERVGLPPTGGRRRALSLPRGHPRELYGRAAAGVAAGALAAAALAGLAGHAPAHVTPIAAAVGVAVAALPRVAWLAAAAGVVVWLTTPGVDRPGTALVLCGALAVVPLLLPRAGLLWSLPALAAGLGAIGVAPAFVAAGGLASTARRRAAVAAAGFVWLALGEIAAGRHWLYAPPQGSAPRGTWEHSVGGAASHALWPLVSTPALLPLVVWAAFAAVLPYVVRGRRGLWFDAGAACVWAAGLYAALDGLTRVMHSHPHGAGVGVVVAALVAVAGRQLLPPAEPGSAHALPYDGFE